MKRLGWLRLGWTAVFGYRLRSGNRVRLYKADEGATVLASFKYAPSVNDELDVRAWLDDRAPFRIEYSPAPKQKTIEIGGQ